MLKKIFLIFIFTIIAVNILSVLPALAQMDMNDKEIMHIMEMGPIIGNKMLHAWISLVAAIIIFILALKFMTGGKLSQPIMLIGFGALADAIIGLFMTHQDHMKFMWLGSMLFSLSVVMGIIWMAKIFGVLRSKKKQ